MPSDRVSVPTLLRVAVAYAVLGGLGLTLAIPPGYASPVFPAAGFALAVSLRLGAGITPAIWIGSLALNTGLAAWSGKLSACTALAAVGIATGAALQAWLGRHLVLRWSREKWQRLEHERDMLQFLLLGGVLACLVSASCGVASLMIAAIVQPGELGYSWWTWYAGDALGVLIGAPLAVGWLLRHEYGWLARLKTMVAPVLGMLLLAILTFLGAARWESDRQQSTLDDKGAELASALEQRFIAHRETLAALSRAIEINPGISLDQFDHFTSVTLRDKPDIFALSFNPYVTIARRTEFERRMAWIYPDWKFQITERNVARQLVRAGDRQEYVTVGYISPLTGNRPAIGFDINSEPKRRAAIARAQQSGRAAVTEPIRLVQEQQERGGVLILSPAFKQVGRAGESVAPSELTGFAVAVIKIDEMAGIATKGLLAPGLAISLEDPATDPASREMYRSDSQARIAMGAPAWQKTLMMADRAWVLKLFATDAYRQAHRSWTAWGIGVAGLLFAALLQMFLLAMTGRTALIKRQVTEQTQEISAKNEALTSSEERYRSVVDSIREVIFQTDTRGSWTFLNPAWTEVTGFAVADSLGQPCLDYVHPDDRAHGQAMCESLFQQGIDSLRHELRWLHRAGGFRWVEVFARPMLNAKGLVIGITGTLMDITERHVAEEKLRAAMQKAEAASLAKGHFLATMSHEIRTPMNGVLGYLDLLKDQSQLLPEASREHLRQAADSATLLRGLLDDVLDFSKIEAGKLSLLTEPFRLGPLARDVLALMRGQLGSKPVTLQQSVDPRLDDLVLQGDALRLRQVLMNLASNAIKFTEQGSVELMMTLEEVAEGGARIRVAMSDTGIGISQEQSQHLFHPFTQADGSITRRFGGTGLGLSISQSLLQLMGSQGLQVSSSPGKGSTFSFEISLPVLDELALARVEQQHIEIGPDTLKDLKVLLVEDNKTNITLATAVLQGMGALVSIATDGQQALDLLARLGSDFDLVLMDMQMPVMDGLTATRAIRANPAWAQLPIVAMTANAYETDRLACLEAGMNDFLAKPLERVRLVQVISSFPEK